MGDVRRTGRTKRMIKEAERLARDGKAVYIFMATGMQAKDVQSGIDKEYPGSGIKCECVPPEFDWVSMRVRGSHSNCEFLVDHHAIESRFCKILEMLHRFD